MEKRTSLTTDVELKGKRYRIAKMSAFVGCGIAMQILTKMLPAGMEGKMDVSLPKGRTELSPAEFEDIQRKCMAVCSRLNMVGDAEVPEPVLLGENWVFKDLEYDIPSVMALTLHALIWNFKSFFEDGALDQILESFGVGQSLFSASK